MYHLEKELTFLKLVSSTHPTQRKAILSTASKQQLKILSEVIHNFLQGVVPLDTEQVTKFSKHRNILRKIAQKKLKAKRIFITKHNRVIGLFLQMIIPKLEA
jgi:2-polyprenyl-3-methyl-5-hydroxy-6-metoxy-1,4-benzoquinol methylase